MRLQTELGTTAAAIVQQEGQQTMHAVQAGAIAHEAAFAGAADQSASAQHGQMVGQGVVPHSHHVGQDTGGQSFRLVVHQRAEDHKTCAVAQCRQCIQRMVDRHRCAE
ncbi:hypothetical protein A7X63_07210 [Stenotrophomonas maltophilia]|nr:hypothetical protein ABW45_13685 [Stenotrophomonas maltophilia]PZS85399.1 hypothetical protein A7X63_07210 [Stenotrophomonas maltophilia]